MSEGARLMVIDDEENIRDLVAMGLRYEGYEVEAHDNGRSALAAVPRFRPDLIVVDVMMPDLDGFEVCKRLQADGERAPVIFLTARTAVTDVRGPVQTPAVSDGTVQLLTSGEARLRRFVMDASHELSTPLTSIRGYAELFHRGLADHPADLAKAMQRIESEGARMGGLVDDLLLLASLDNGRPLQRAPVDLVRIVADAAADLRAAAPDRRVTLETTGPVMVVGDENRLRQVVGNLAANARRHTPAGTPIVLRARVDGLLGVVDVADEGPGLPPDAAPHVFDRLYRVDKARARADGGISLGLSIVSSIAEAHGGHASLATVEGQGATFSVAIPLALPLALPQAAELASQTPRPDQTTDSLL